MAKHNIDVEVRAKIDEFRDSMKEVENTVSRLKKEWTLDDRATRGYSTRGEKLAKSYESLTQQYNLQKDAVKALTAERQKLFDQNMQDTEMYSLLTADLEKFSREAELTAKRLKGVSEEYHTYFNSFSEMGRHLDSVGNKLESLSGKLQGISSTFAPITLGLTGIGAASFKAFNDYEQGLVGVQKTTDFTAKELGIFKKQIDDIASTKPLDIGDLLRVAEVGGQLDVAQSQLAEFSEVFNELAITTELDIENAALKMAQFANVLTPHGEVFDKWTELGSVITELGNNTATTEETIIEFSNRLVGAGSTIGLTADQIMGYSASLGAAGLLAEAGGTNLSKTWMQMEFAVAGVGDKVTEYDAGLEALGITHKEVKKVMDEGGLAAENLAQKFEMSVGEMAALNDVASKGTGNLELYADAAGLTADEFAKLWEKNPAEAFNLFIEGLAEMEKSGESVALYLDMMDISSERQRDVLLKLVQNAGDLRDNLEMAKNQFEEGTALAEEASQFYDTTEGQMKLIKNNIEATARELGEHLAPIILEVTEDLGDMVGRFGELDKGTQELIVKGGIIIGLISPIAGILGNITGAAADVIKAFSHILGEEGLGGMIGKARAAKEGLETLGGAAKSSDGIGGVVEVSGKAKEAIEEIGTAATGAKGFKGVAKAAKEATGTIGGLVGEISGWALALGAAGAVAYAVTEEVKEGKNWNKDPKLLTEDVFIRDDGTIGRKKEGSRGAGGYNPGGEILRFEEETKELMTAAEVRQQEINYILSKGIEERQSLTKDETATISQLYHEQDMALLEGRREKKQKELDLFAELTGNFEEGTKEAYQKIYNVMNEEEHNMTNLQAEIHSERQALIEEYNQASISRRAEILNELAELDAKWRELEIDAYAQTEEEKSVLMARSQEFRLEQNEKTFQAMLEQAAQYRESVIQEAEDEYEQRAVILGRMLEQGEITKDQYDTMLKAAIDYKDKSIESANEALEGISSAISEIMPGWTAVWDEESGKIMALNKETGDSVDLTGKTWAEAMDEMTKGTKNFSELTDKAMENVRNQLGQTESKVGQTESALDRFANKHLVDKSATYTINIVERLTRAKNVPSSIAPMGHRSGFSSHMAGISYVPYNEYYAMLHEGERVLTKRENEAYNKASVENVNNLLTDIRKNLQEGAKNAGAERISQEVTLEVNLNDVVIKDDRDIRQVAKDIGRELKKEVRLG